MHCSPILIVHPRSTKKSMRRRLRSRWLRCNESRFLESSDVALSWRSRSDFPATSIMKSTLKFFDYVALKPIIIYTEVSIMLIQIALVPFDILIYATTVYILFVSQYILVFNLSFWSPVYAIQFSELLYNFFLLYCFVLSRHTSIKLCYKNFVTFRLIDS